MTDDTAGNSLLDVLSVTERQIAELLLAGMNSSEISKRLSVSFHQVAETSKLIRQKFGVTSVTELRDLFARRSAS